MTDFPQQSVQLMDEAHIHLKNAAKLSKHWGSPLAAAH
jgi:hypothetical protein